MSDKKKQHYVPQFYMRNFSDNQKKFHLYNVNNDEYIGLVPYKDQCYEKYFYGKSCEWEDKLGSFEQKWAVVIDSIIKGNYSNEIINGIKEFAIFQMIRTKMELTRQTESISKVGKEFLNMYLGRLGLLNEDTKKVVDDIVLQNLEDINTPANLLDLFQNYSHQISDLSFLHIKNKTKKEFISSDNPIICFNKFNNNVGLMMNGLVIMFSISPFDLVVIYDGKTYPKYANQLSIYLFNKYVVKNFNALVYAEAYEIVFSKSLFDKSLSSPMFKKIREDNLNIDNNLSVGNYERKFIIVNRKPLMFNFTFPFLKIDKELDSIKHDFRTPIPRLFDEEYKIKLYEECNLIPSLLSKNKSREINDLYIREYKINHQKYYRLVLIKYWNLKKDLK